MRAASRPVVAMGIVALATVLGACGTPEDRFVSRQDALSLVAPPGWASTRDKGTLVFTAPTESVAPEHTIAVRAVAKDDKHATNRTADSVVAATAQVLAALPHVQVGAPAFRRQGRFAATEFTLTFVPPSHPGAPPVDRVHLVLIGDKHIYHVMHTSPQGRLSEAADVFAAVVASLKEEV